MFSILGAVKHISGKFSHLRTVAHFDGRHFKPDVQFHSLYIRLRPRTPLLFRHYIPGKKVGMQICNCGVIAMNPYLGQNLVQYLNLTEVEKTNLTVIRECGSINPVNLIFALYVSNAPLYLPTKYPMVGDIACFYDMRRLLTHYAIYLSNDLYVSQLSANSGIYIQTAKQIANMLQLTDEPINGNAWWGKCAVGLHTDKDFAVNINTANIVDYQDKKGKMPISQFISL